MRNARRIIHAFLLAAVLLGVVLTAAPDAYAAAAQAEVVEKNTVCQENRIVTSDLKVIGGTLDLKRNTLTVSGDLYLEDGALKLSGGTLNVRGNLYISGGNLSLAYGTVNVSGELIHTDGKLNVSRGTVNVAGDYHIAVPEAVSEEGITWGTSYGELIMTTVNDTVNVGGDFYMDAAYDSKCSAGILTVSGDFTQISGHKPFQASGSHKVVLNGKEVQTVSLQTPSSTFAKLEIANEKGVRFTDHFAAKELTAASGEAKLLSEGAVCHGLKLNVPKVTVTGDLTLSGDVNLVYYTMKIDGNLIQTDGNLLVDWGTLDITGDYYLATPAEVPEVTEAAETEESAEAAEEPESAWSYSLGELTMQYPRATVNVGGDFYMDASNGIFCTAGTLTVSGNFTQQVDYTPKKFTASNTHKVVLNGKEAQTVTLTNASSSFANLEVANSNGIIVTDYFSAASLTAENGEVKILSDGAVFENVTVNAPLVTVDGILIQDGCLKLNEGTLAVSGNLIQTNGEVNVGKGTLDVAGNYYIAVPEMDEEGATNWYSSYGKLTVSNKKATVSVGGDLYVDAQDGVSCTAGTLTVLGNVTELEEPSSKSAVKVMDATTVSQHVLPIRDVESESWYLGRTVWVSAASPYFHVSSCCGNMPDPMETSLTIVKANNLPQCPNCCWYFIIPELNARYNETHYDERFPLSR